MPNAPTDRQALVFGATGFIGRWLVRQLVADGVNVVAAVRSNASGQGLREWLTSHHVPVEPSFLTVDFTRDGMGVDATSPELSSITEIYNVAGAYQFGMTAEDARAANVDGSRRVVELAAQLPTLSRVVHLSGYRVDSHDLGPDPWSATNWRATYARLGAYEASKIESDAVVRARADELGVSLSIANPATVVGDWATGETDQKVGLAASVLDLSAGRLAALPGGSNTFVPVVSVDYLARFMALLPAVPESAGEAYWILDDQTPALADLLTLVGRHLGVKVPRMRVPVWMVRMLPVRLSRANPETLSFMVSDRYPTTPANELAQQHGLTFPPVEEVLTRWADYLVGQDATPSEGDPR